MRILIIHTRYTQPGGEDVVFEAEAALLRSRGHEVVELLFDNQELEELPVWQQGKISLWNRGASRLVRTIIQRNRVNLVHVHNTFAFASPAVVWAAKAEHVPVVMSLHNPRLICPSANFWFSGGLCTECVDRTFAWPGVVRGCYRKSKMRTFAVAAITGIHDVIGTWREKVDRFVVFTKFYYELFSNSGIPTRKLVIKPHFVSDIPAMGGGWQQLSSRAEEQGCPRVAFVGRLDPEKGVHTLIHAWKLLRERGLDFQLELRGDGKLGPWVWQEVRKHDLNVRYVPRLSKYDLFELISNSRCLVWPSEGWYETFGLVAIEAFACGTPVVASRTGVATSIVRDGVTGLHFRPGDPADLAGKVEWLMAHPAERERMRRAARAEFEANYTAERNYGMLMRIYGEAIAHHAGRVRGVAGA